VTTTAFQLGLPLATLALLAGAAHAQTTAGPFYVEASIGMSHFNGDYAKQVRDSVANSTVFKFASASYDSCGNLGGRVAIGWRALPNLAFELGSTEFGRIDSRASVSRLQAPEQLDVIRGKFRLDAITLDAVGMLPVTEKFTAIARVGVARTEQKYSQTRTVTNEAVPVFTSYPANQQTRLHWGVGAQYALNANVALVANYERIENVGHDFSSRSIDNGSRAGTFGYGLLSVGMRYTF